MIVEKEQRARLKVKRIKGFYTHSFIYVVFNIALLLIKIVGTNMYGEYFMGPIWHFSTLLAPLFWGIGLAAHGIGVFSFGSKWEQRQIQKYLEQDS